MTPLKMALKKRCDATGSRDILLAGEMWHKGLGLW